MGGSTHTTSQKYDGVIVQSSLKGIPVTKGWGTAKVGCNLIDYLDFSSKKVSQAGKGGGAQPNYDYYATLVMAIELGPIAGIRTIYKDSAYYIAQGSGSKEVNGTTITISAKTTLQAAGLTQLFLGTIFQSPWTYLSANHPANALGYSGIAYAAAENYNLNSSATTPNFGFEVQRVVRATVNGVVVDDANPADILDNLLPDVPRWPAVGAIADLTFYRTYCYAQGLLLSPTASQGRQASDLITEILTCSNSDCFWSEGELKVAPLGDTAITANGVTYTPNLTPVYALTWDDILPNSSGEDPIQWDIKPTDQCYNYISLGFLDRSQQYANDSVPAIDQASYNQFGKVQANAVTYESICDAGVAATVAQLSVQRSANQRRTAKILVPELFGLLDPMDLIEIPAPNGATVLVRINEVNEQEDGSIELDVEEMLVGTSHAPLYTRQNALGIAANFAIDPGDSAAPVIINPPTSLTGGQFEAWIATAGVGPQWGGAAVWVSLDGEDFYQQGVISQPGRYGVTTVDFPAGSDPDTTDTLTVDLTISGGALTTGNQAAADAQTTLCAVGTELIAYSSATLTAPSKYSLGSYIRRGLEGTTIADQPSGSEFLRLDDAILAIPYNAGQIGKTVYVKLQSFNLYGDAYQDLSLCETYTFVAEPNGANVGEVTWSEIQGVPALLESYVTSGGTAVNTQNVGQLSAAQIQQMDAQVAASVAAINQNAGNIAQAMLQGTALQALVNAETSLGGQPVATVIATNQAQDQTAISAYASYFSLLGATFNNNTAWAFNGSSVFVTPTQTLAQHLNYVQTVLGDGSVTIASINQVVSGQTGRITVAVNSNGQAVGFNTGTSGTPASGYFDIVSPNFRLIDTSSGQTLVPLSYTSGVGWIFNSNVAINGDLLIAGTITTGAINPFAITHTPYMTDTTVRNLGAVGSSPVTVVSLTEQVSGGPVKINLTARFLNSDGSHDQIIELVLLRDGTAVDAPFDVFVRQNSSSLSGGQPGSNSAVFLDAGASVGQHTWSVTAQLLGGTGNSITQSSARMIIEDLKTE